MFLNKDQKSTNSVISAFTMAEILLSLTIIGVVAAITLPSLTGNINERTWNTQRKALYARFSQALALMPNLNNYGTLKEVEGEDGSTSIEDTAAIAFLTEGLAKVMKINNICDNDHLTDCGIPSKIIPLSGASSNVSPITLDNIKTLREFNPFFTSSYSFPIDTKAAAFETQNGESILVYYNPNCINDMQVSERHYTQSKMCANFVYDLNGSKGPNTMGKDIGFITALFSSDPEIVAPMPTGNELRDTQFEAGKRCKAQAPESRLPNINEATAMCYNKLLIGTQTESAYYYWTSSTIPSTMSTIPHAWLQRCDTGERTKHSCAYPENIRCIKR